jgi:hypothetical protein
MLVTGAQATGDAIVALGRGLSASATLDPVPAPRCCRARRVNSRPRAI